MLAINAIAPAFSLTDQRGNTVTLADLLADGPVVLYFYPMNFTPTCTKQACMFRDAFDDLREAGIRVVGINTSTETSHDKFAAAYNLPFTLLSDPGRQVAGLYKASGLFGLMTKRISYLIDTDGRIADRQHADWRVTPHKQFTQRILARQTP